MNIDNKLDVLSSIKQVETPPFLLTRIKQQIKNLGDSPAPVIWKWSFASIAIVVLALNLSIVLKGSNSSDSDGIKKVVSSMGLQNNNILYNE